MKCQCHIVKIYVRNWEISVLTGIDPVSDLTICCRNSVFGHALQRHAGPPSVPLPYQSVTQSPPQTRLEASPRPSQQLTSSAGTTTLHWLSCGEDPSSVVIQGWCYDPRRLCTDYEEKIATSFYVLWQPHCSWIYHFCIVVSDDNPGWFWDSEH